MLSTKKYRTSKSEEKKEKKKRAQRSQYIKGKLHGHIKNDQ